MNAHHLPSEWPHSLCDYLSTYGRPTDLQKQGGQSQASVWRIDFQQNSFIVKRALEREGFFYKNIAQPLQTQGVSIPELLWQDQIGTGSWLVLEHIPNQLPRSRWLGDPEVLHSLSHLHQSQLDQEWEAGCLYQPQWTEAMNEQAVKIFDAKQGQWLMDILSTLGNSSQHLFHPQHWISGDPNPTNWGVNENQQVVLYDWERFTRGTAALDLAITMPGLPDKESFREVATCYREYHAIPLQSGETEISSFMADIIAAKIWSFVEYISTYQTTETKITPESIAWLAKGFPGWLAEMVNV